MPILQREYLSHNPNESKAHEAFIALSNLTVVLDHCLDRVFWINGTVLGKART